ncbi:MAG: polymerase sigma factor, sigma-70 family, partial [Acidobacteria bacterium]|nr:polymerase sigma factor, sigma-70 family [Acidobacteriota bacterium]
RSSLATYITIVVRRLLVDQRRAEGRWYSSAEAQRRGEAAMALERLMRRDHRSLDEAIAIAGAEHPDLTTQQLREMAAALPERAARTRMVAIAEGDEERFPARSAADDLVSALDLQDRSDRASRVMRAALATLAAEDRVVLRLRFGKGASIADVARALDVAQRPLYRRIEALLARLRRALEEAGIDAKSVVDLIGTPEERLDFGLIPGKSEAMYPSIQSEGGDSEGQS